MEWTPQERLNLIKKLAMRSFNRPTGETHQLLMERILFLCDGSPEFLEANKINFQDILDNDDN